MPKKTASATCFSTEQYLAAEEKAIRARLAQFDRRLYLEIGGKLLDDNHAARVLPGYDGRAKLNLLLKLKEDIEIIYCVSARQLENGKIRSDFGFSYGEYAIRALQNFENFGFGRPKVALNLFSGENAAGSFIEHLERLGYQVFSRHVIADYPNNLDEILSERGFGADPYIPVEKPLVVVNGPGPNSGKLSTCLGQLYHEYRTGRRAGYAKLETFPVWNLPLDHPVNIAYEASTADLGDINLVDPYHLAAHQETAINYNRDIEAFPIVRQILQKISGGGKGGLTYQSPTEMGVNELKRGITDDAAAQAAAKQEIIFRLFRYQEEFQSGVGSRKAVDRTQELLARLNLRQEDRPTVLPARRAAAEATNQKDKGNEGLFCGAAIELPGGKIITGKNSPLMHAESAALLNAIKELSEIPDEIDLLPKSVIQNLSQFKQDVLQETTVNLDAHEVLIALSLSRSTNPLAEKALESLPKLRACPMHTTHELNEGDKKALRKLGIWYTTDALPTKQLII